MVGECSSGDIAILQILSRKKKKTGAITSAGFYMNLNVTKRPFGRLDVSVGKQHKSGKIMFYAFLK